MNEWNEAWPQHRELHTLLFTNSVWVILCPTGLWTLKGCETGLRFIVLIREDLKVLTICGCNYKGSTFSSVILRPWVLVRSESNSRPPTWQPDAQPTEPPVHRSRLTDIFYVHKFPVGRTHTLFEKSRRWSPWCCGRPVLSSISGRLGSYVSKKAYGVWGHLGRRQRDFAGCWNM